MASRRAWSWLALVGGIFLALISIFADQLGLGAMPGFGWRQIIGLVIGLVLILLAVWRMR